VSCQGGRRDGGGVLQVRPDRQTVLFSATFPRQVEALARSILADPIEVQVRGGGLRSAPL
jgi:superfamily II DNA/RNA helicase